MIAGFSTLKPNPIFNNYAKTPGERNRNVSGRGARQKLRRHRAEARRKKRRRRAARGVSLSFQTFPQV
jgi:hypothetical protein